MCERERERERERDREGLERGLYIAQIYVFIRPIELLLSPVKYTVKLGARK